MKKRSILKISAVLFAITTIFLFIGMAGNNTAKIISFVLLILVTILNIFTKFIKE